jgi:murein DD-endopeptidase MepM/ murein hydrolase activator NlpD
MVLAIFFATGVLTFWSTDDRRREATEVAVPEERDSRPDGALVIPVKDVAADQLIDTWAQSRDNGARVHQAIDIPAPMGTPVMAAMAGRVEKLFVSKLGGLTVYVRSTDDKWLTYYAHLLGYAAGLREGQGVAEGQVIAFVGDTGNAGPGNTHLHFAVHRMAPGELWYQGTPIDPYPLLARKPAAR